MVWVSYEDVGQVCTYFGWGLVWWESCCLGHFWGYCWFMFFVDFGCVCSFLRQYAWFAAGWVSVVVGGQGGFLVVAGIILLGVVCMGISSCEGQIGLHGGHSWLGCVV